MRYFTVEEAAAVLPRVEDLLRRLRALPEEAAEAQAARTSSSCRALGEDRIGFWHGTTEGYAGRKPLAQLPGARFH